MLVAVAVVALGGFKVAKETATMVAERDIWRLVAVADRELSRLRAVLVELRLD